MSVLKVAIRWKSIFVWLVFLSLSFAYLPYLFQAVFVVPLCPLMVAYLTGKYAPRNRFLYGSLFGVVMSLSAISSLVFIGSEYGPNKLWIAEAVAIVLITATLSSIAGYLFKILKKDRKPSTI